MDFSLPPLFLLLFIDGLLILILSFMIKCCHSFMLLYVKVLSFFVVFRLFSYWSLLVLTNRNFHQTIFLKIIQVFWLMGSIILLIRYGLNQFKIRRNMRFLNKLPNNYLTSEIKQIIPKKISLYQLDSIQSPCTWGIFNPIIIFPSKILDPDTQAYVVKHELQHIKNHDSLKK